MRLDYAVGSILLLLVASCWYVTLYGTKGKRVLWWRTIVPAAGLFLVTISFSLFLAMRFGLSRSPDTAVNFDTLLRFVRRYTRFYAEYLALVGGLLGMFGKGYIRWAVAIAGLITAAWWFFFMLSLV